MTPSERVDVLDFLRGVAVLGMLVANIPWHMGNSMSRVLDPDVTSAAAWLLQYLFFDQRFMPIFCMLFGAGYWILSQHPMNKKNFRVSYLKRMAVLLTFGICHSYLLWPGDILITYAVCGPLLLFFHRCSVRSLFIWGCLFKGIDLIFGQWPGVYEASLEAVLFSWWVDYGDSPSTAATAYAGSYIDLFAYNAWRNQFLQWTALPYFRIWNALGLMLVGIAAYRTGLLQGNKTIYFYRKMFLVCMLFSIPLVIYGVVARIGINNQVGHFFGFNETLPLYNLTFRLGCTIMSFGLIAAIHVLWPIILDTIKRPVINVGKTALSNYVFQSLFFIILIHVFGFYSFDSIDHDTMLVWVLILWGLHLVLSRYWLMKYSRGPLEILYRRTIK